MRLRKRGNRTLILYKPLGLTPLKIIKKFKEENPQFQKVRMGYAGRLDPMAEGALLVLIGDENKNKKKYEDLDKEYEFEVLLGMQTDTYDILGKILKTSPLPKNLNEKIKKFVSEKIGETEQEYPPYSSKAVKGKSLFWWARRRKLSEIEIPKRRIKIYSLEFRGVKILNSKELLGLIQERVGKVKGDFRQKEILKDWKKILERDQWFTVLKFKISCSGGTYIRSLANELGGLAFSIKRTKIGK